MKSIRNWVAMGAFSLLVLGIPAVASAQWGGQNDPYGRNNDPYGRNGGYNNGTYGNSGSVRDLKNKTREFQRQLDRDLDRSRVNGTRREDEINDTARRFRDAVNRLDNNDYNNNNRNNGGYNNRNDNEMRNVFNLAAQIERSIGRANVSYNTRNLWSSIRNDLQVLSRGYNTYNNGRGNNNGGWGNGRVNTNRNGLPSWWPF